MATYDCYVVHNGEDDARIKLGALRRFARQFERAKGRPPVAFVGTLCDLPSAPEPDTSAAAVSSSADAYNGVAQLAVPPIEAVPSGNSAVRDVWLAAQHAWLAARLSQPSARSSAAARASGAGSAPTTPSHTASLRSLEHLPVRLARSSQLLVLASAPLFERLWPTMEIFIWWLTGGGQDMVRVLPVVANEDGGGALLAAVDAFHVMYCDEPRPAERRRILRHIEIASTSAFNETVRALYPAVGDKLARIDWTAGTSVDGDSDGSADDEWLGGQWLA